MTDRDLVRLYWPSELRPAFDALFAIDDAMGEIVAGSTQPALGAIRLAWWREALQRLDAGPAPAEPRLHAAQASLLPLNVGGAELGALTSGWAELLEEEWDVAAMGGRGAALFAIGAKLLGEDDRLLESAGRLFALADAARRGAAPLLATDGDLAGLAGHRFAPRLRPLTALARLAARDIKQAPAIEPEATPGRALALLRHRLSGRIA